MNQLIYNSVINNSLSQDTKDSSELQPNEALSLRCILNEKDKDDAGRKEDLLWQRLRSKLSNYCIRAVDELQHEIFQMLQSKNFLVRNEAKFFPFSQVNITNEDLNAIINANNRHMTMCLNWKASISDNGKFLRNAFGQHFVQIDNLFES
jgi:hypothetical protein